DTGVVPVIRDKHYFGVRSVSPGPVANQSPGGRGFRLDGNEVHWKNWSFHYRLDRRAGLIVSVVRYRDQGRERLILYRGSIGEIFVPYMDPDPGWSFRTYMDVGEYGFGLLASQLTPGIDCPAEAAFLDAALPGDRGDAPAGKSVICLSG